MTSIYLLKHMWRIPRAFQLFVICFCLIQFCSFFGSKIVFSTIYFSYSNRVIIVGLNVNAKRININQGRGPNASVFHFDQIFINLPVSRNAKCVSPYLTIDFFLLHMCPTRSIILDGLFSFFSSFCFVLFPVPIWFFG